FRLYITTKLRSPHYLPELSVKVSLPNFMITVEGLEDQLLGIVVPKERPDLEEEEKAQLILQLAENKEKLQEIEDKILQILSSAEGNILPVELFEKQKAAEEKEGKIDNTRDSSPATLDVDVIYSLYCNICRSLFEKDKLLFALLLCAYIPPSRAELDLQEFAFFTFGAVGLAAVADPNPDPSVFSDKTWAELGHLFALPAFHVLTDLNPLERRPFAKAPDPWEASTSSSAQMNKRYPVNYNESMNTVLIQEMIRFNRLIHLPRKPGQCAESHSRPSGAELEEVAKGILILATRSATYAPSGLSDAYDLAAHIAGTLDDKFFQTWYEEGMTLFCRPTTGVLITDLFFDGARWSQDSHSIAESASKVLYDLLPVIWFRSARQQQQQAGHGVGGAPGGTTYGCPVYKTSPLRGVLSTTGHSANYVICVRPPSDRPETQWILHGVAALQLQLDALAAGRAT
ncbi:Dynein heavy chain 7, axonemal, partial [Cladochytrium tenue]